MNVTVDESEFDRLQLALTKELVGAVHRALVRAGIPEALLHRATADVTFSVCTTMDASLRMEIDGNPLRPAVTFLKPDMPNELISAGGTSWMHEYALGFADEYFESLDDK
jgi:hypothetical protein